MKMIIAIIGSEDADDLVYELNQQMCIRDSPPHDHSAKKCIAGYHIQLNIPRRC